MKSLTKITPITVEKRVVIILGSSISDGEEDKYWLRKLITEVGIICSPVAHRVNNIHCPNEFPSLSKLSHALIPVGVAIPFIPSKFAEIFAESNFSCSSLVLPNKNLIGFFSILESLSFSLLCSISSKIPNQTLYTAIIFKESEKAFSPPDKRVGKIISGFLKIKTTKEENIIITKMQFIVKYYANIFILCFTFLL